MVKNPITDDTTIWRYMNLAELISILQKDTLWFCRIASFDDPFEGQIPEGTTKIADQSDPAATRRAIYLLRKLVYANCWHISEGQSDAMWKLYTDDQHGLAIESTVGELKNALDSSREISINSVDYIEWSEAKVMPTDPVRLGFLKREAFSHEKELRCVFQKELEDSDVIHPDAYELESPEGEYISIDCEILINRVHISPFSPGWLSSVIEDALLTYNMYVPLEESELYDDPGEDLGLD